MTELHVPRCRPKSVPPHYYLDRENGADRPYLMNHCRCGAKLDDDLLHGDIGAPLWPDTADGFGYIKLFRLPIAEAIPVECSFAIGGRVATRSV